MITETMTIHEALSELKTLDARISGKTLSSYFTVANKHSNKKINGKTIEEFTKNAEEAFQSITDLLKRRKAIRNAVSQSNAVTKININGTEYTIAEAIELKKTGTDLYHELFNTMATQLKNANAIVSNENAKIDQKADDYVAKLFGSTEKSTNTDTLAVREAYIAAQTYELVSMPKLEERMNAMYEEIMAFESAVDSKISVSNALTTITVEY